MRLHRGERVLVTADNSLLEKSYGATTRTHSQNTSIEEPRLTRPSSDVLSLLPGLLATADWLGVVATGFAVNKALPAFGAASTEVHPLAILLAATLTADYVCLSRGYSWRPWASCTAQQARVSACWGVGLLSLAAVYWTVGRPEEFLRPAAQLWYLTAWACLLAIRSVFCWQVRRWERQGLLVRNVAVLGNAMTASRLARRLSRCGDTHLVGYFLNDTKDDTDPGPRDGASGDTDLLVALATRGEVDEVIVALPWVSSSALNKTIGKFAALQTVIKIDTGLEEFKVVPLDFGFTADVPTLTVQRRPLVGWGAIVKRVEDCVLSATLLFLFAPVLLAIAILIKIDSSGPVIFRQERFGFNNNRFRVYKFRSMRHEAQPDPSVPQAKRSDPRVTRVGAILRRTSLDELPQLFNVLVGDMSLVGPRPHAAAHNEKFAAMMDGYLARHRMKPGITGWAQVNGARGETESLQQMKCRLEYDLNYIANWSLTLDLKILVMTIPTVVRGTNAY
jgi:putative colanic acid biosynthesis UDP-glucose lipid carrier transferase